MKLSLLIPLCLSTLLGAGTAASAQGGGFNAGELFIYSPVQSAAYNGYGILRVNPVTGSSSVLAQTNGNYGAQGLGMAFDPYRQRLVFSAAIGSNFNHVWFADGDGNLQNMTAANYPVGLYLDNFAPTADGRLYCHHDGGNTATPLLWFDSANILRVLYDSDGVTPMKIDGDYYSYNGMIHDAATNSLFVASTKPKPGFPEWATNVRKLPLSADGTRVIGPVGNVQFEISPNPFQTTSGENPRGWSHGPNGQLVLCVNSVDYLLMPRMLLVDPVTSAISVYCYTGDDQPPGVYNQTPGGAWSSALNKVVVVDYNNATLHAYAQGEIGGSGSVIATNPALSGYGTTLQVVSVPPSECTGGWIAYGLGLKGKGNIVPKLTGGGCPEPGAPITLTLSDAVGGAGAALFVGLSKAAVPFKGGTFHIGSLLLTSNLAVGGAPGVAGAGSLSLPTALPPLPALSGASIFLQGAFSDAAAVQGVSLTQGLELEIG
jgi:hypothetical protein